jgi:IMP dehydrogenase
MDKLCFEEGLTFDDVLVEPAHSQILPREAQLDTVFTRNIHLNVRWSVPPWIL